ncbi:MAG TPA: hypothetical protein VN747_06380 [Burkholderiales bacterium]|jgi:hypothetical protein|nr:hypothetical protein [Burkholderiales bacterium]
MSACFMVRARIGAGVARDEFERWYRDEHLPDALAAFKAKRAWRAWSGIDPAVHYAFYEFESMAAARAIEGTAELKRLVADFDRAWGDRVARSRDFIETVQEAER